MQKIVLLASFLLNIFFNPLQASTNKKAIVLGSGIGGLTSAIYLARAGVDTTVITGNLLGGLITESHMVQNWPGEITISGDSLMEKVIEQAKENGVKFLDAKLTAVDFSKRPFNFDILYLNTEKKEKLLAESCIIAMGTKPNFLGIPGEKKYWGKGISNCAICDGSLYKNMVVGVVGGGDAAILEASYLADLAKEVQVFVRKDKLKAGEQGRVNALKEKPNVRFFYNTEVTEVFGNDQSVTGVLLKKNGKEEKSSLDGLFLAIGSTPNSEVFKGKLKMDKEGYITRVQDQETSVNGVYVVGDISDPVYKQAISAAGDGAKAALQSQDFLMHQPKKKVATVDGSIIEIQSADELTTIFEASEKPVVIDFYATWCKPCKQISPLIESSAQDLSGKVRFVKANVDQAPDLAAKYQIKAMPTILLLDASGKVKERGVGSNEISTLLKDLKEKYSSKE